MNYIAGLNVFSVERDSVYAVTNNKFPRMLGLGIKLQKTFFTVPSADCVESVEIN